MNSFINDSISYGISNYMLIKQGKDYTKEIDDDFKGKDYAVT